MKPTMRRAVDVLVVTTASTLGHEQAESALISYLAQLGVTFAVSVPSYRRHRWLRMAHPFLDFAEAYAINASVRRALRTFDARTIIYSTSLSTIFEPSSRLRRAGIRFDAVAAENRLGLRNAPLRLLERRSLSRARVLMPWSAKPGRFELDAQGRIRSPFPPSVNAHPIDGLRLPMMVCYAGNPHKKGLDLVLRAWAIAAPPTPWTLQVAGIDPELGKAWLRRHRVPEPVGLVWRGKMSPTDYRNLTSEAEVVVAGSRYEDFGIAQLEALADGAVLVTMPSAGPYEALSIARSLDAKTVAATITP